MLIDTNVLIAAVVPNHDHHDASAELLLQTRSAAIAAHSLAEFVNRMTRNQHYSWSGEAVRYQIDQFEKRFEVLNLRSSQYAAALADFLAAGHRGPMVYDFLIGTHAVVNGLDKIVTWNDRHFRPMFPKLSVSTPAEQLKVA